MTTNDDNSKPSFCLKLDNIVTTYYFCEFYLFVLVSFVLHYVLLRYRRTPGSSSSSGTQFSEVWVSQHCAIYDVDPFGRDTVHCLYGVTNSLTPLGWFIEVPFYHYYIKRGDALPSSCLRSAVAPRIGGRAYPKRDEVDLNTTYPFSGWTNNISFSCHSGISFVILPTKPFRRSPLCLQWFRRQSSQNKYHSATNPNDRFAIIKKACPMDRPFFWTSWDKL